MNNYPQNCDNELAALSRVLGEIKEKIMKIEAILMNSLVPYEEPQEGAFEPTGAEEIERELQK